MDAKLNAELVTRRTASLAVASLVVLPRCTPNSGNIDYSEVQALPWRRVNQRPVNEPALLLELDRYAALAPLTERTAMENVLNYVVQGNTA